MNNKNKLGFILYIIISVLLVSKVNLKQEILLDQKENSFIRLSRSFFVNNKNIFIVDAKAANIKNFNMDGSLKAIFGKRGAGPNEFLYPNKSAISKNQLVISDANIRHFLIFDYNGKNSFNYKKKILDLALAEDFKIIGKNSLLVAGHTGEFNSKYHHLYVLNFNNNTKDCILPSYIAFGCKSINEYNNRYNNEIKYVGRNGFCDFDYKYYYFVLESNLQIIQINRKTKKIKTFGKSTKNYIKPFVSKELKNSYGKNIKIFWKEIKKFSHIRKIFVTKSDMIGVIYSNGRNNKINLYLQFYSQDGTLKSEELLLSSLSDSLFDINLYFNKSDNYLYILDNEPSVDDDIRHKILSFKISK